MASRLNFGQSLDFVGAFAAGGNPKIFLDGGPTLEELTLETNLEADEFTLRIEVDGEERVKITGTEMLAREAYEGRSATAGQFVLSFADVMARTLQGETMSGLTTQPGQRVLVSLEIAGTVTPVTPTGTLYAETSGNRPEEFRLYILPEIIPITKTGENDFSSFRRGVRPRQNWIRRIFHFGAVSKLSIKQDDMTVFGDRELPKAINDARLKRNGKTVPAACYVYDPILKGSVTTDMLDTYAMRALRFKLTTTDSNDVTALTEYMLDVRPVKQAA
ncbi:MAG: hypothetical protein CMQ34_09810 [Gammaproteobacteria bacterium]|nr:hypothetical protein [Gammaproteobacteria bacterium]|tara:strand:+ start:970 stop:1794 length:825 start_codon:yes stop_codon:yes gene_type:complete